MKKERCKKEIESLEVWRTLQGIHLLIFTIDFLELPGSISPSCFPCSCFPALTCMHWLHAFG